MYVGPVASAKNASEIYAGVAWDDATRGKHDGSVLCRATNKIVRHFSYPSFSKAFRSMGGLEMRSSSSPEFGGNKGCSFMRPSKLDFGVPLDDALLRSKYVEEDDPHLEAPNNIITGATVRTSGGRSKPIELLGELKIRKKQQLEKLKEISLRNLGVSSILQHSFGHLRGIDLSGNLLHDWKEVAAMLDSFPCLEELCLSSNLLHDTFASPVSTSSSENDRAKLDGIIGTDFQPKKQCYDMLKRLVLNNCGLSSFRTLQILDHFFPNLDDLCAVSNDFSKLNMVSSSIGSQEETEEVTPIKGFDRLVTLDLSDCCISSWGHVERFRALPCLRSLSLNDNAIASIGRHDVNNNKDRYFESLKSIDLVGNQVSLWKDIANINALPVTSLRFRNNPVTSTLGASESRSSLIARLCNLNFLNSSPVSAKERIEAERRYIRIVARELLLVEESGDDVQERREYILTDNPRFDELKEMHRDSMLGVNSNLTQGGRLANDTMNIAIVSMAPSSCTKDPLRKRLPSSLTVGRLKSMCSRAFDIDYANIILHFREANVKDSLPTLLDDEEHSLSYFGVSDGCEILVNEGER
eukprot:CAMPEP_0116015104 /NCGR_PEP_ID=MMETSP0321-20121206/6645_1 /TAXON_ID=163516 /ORGANISM="Leptocylindrus danicus var. danicus, Strain B650" /LENGTH=581 /DNA_ID=CAMNT_0003484825 /DNA_START=41 /DNA_END=1786 /DNA_ORIENTATION=+